MSKTRVLPHRLMISLTLILNISCHDPTPAPDTLVLGKIYTMNPAQPQVSGLAIQNGRFSFVGDRISALKLAGEKTRILELNGATAVPGLIDAHLHVAGIGSAIRSINLSDAKNFQEIVRNVSERAARNRPGTLILGRGWHQSKWERPPEDNIGGFPKHNVLSQVTPDHPVLLEHASGHSVLLNQYAMELLKITGSTQVPEGGLIVLENGTPTGLLHEAAIELTHPLLHYNLETALNLVEAAQHHILSQGITSAHDAGAGQIDLAAQKRLAEEGRLTLRLYSMIDATDDEAMKDWLEHGHLIATDKQRLTIRSIKVQADGALGSRTAWLHEPYSDNPESVGVSTYNLERLENLVLRTRPDKWQINVHAIGDRANSEVLDIFSRTTAGYLNHRFRIEHAQHLKDGDAQAFADIGIIASMQPIHLSSDRPWAIYRLGSRRIEEGAYRWQDLVLRGVVVAAGSDAPVEPVNPIANFYAAITRRQLNGTPEQGYEANQRLSREEALYAMTLAAAYAAFEEDEKGSIEIGKLADLTALSNDLMNIEEEKILETVIEWTMVGGDVVYKRSNTH